MSLAKPRKRQITADDLLRRQEMHPVKRRKLDASLSVKKQQQQYSSGESASEDNETEEVLGEQLDSLISEDSEVDEEDDQGEDSRSGPDDELPFTAPSSGLSRITAAPRRVQELNSRIISTPASSRKKPNQPGLMESETIQSPLVSTSFVNLSISRALVNALNSMAIHTPTDVQAACIPPLLEGLDCVGNAKTGSGKTVAFALPILQKLLVDPYGIFAVVLTPTRELAFQISEQFSVLGAPLNVRAAVIVGGMDMVAQAIELSNRPHVIIATPGRIVDHLRSSNGEWSLSKVKFLVLDEADRLLTPTFAPELAYLFQELPRDRQTALFTATMTESIEKLIEAPPRPGKSKPFVHRMSTAGAETVETLTQSYILVPSHVREVYLFHLLCNPPESICHLRREPPEPVKRGKPAKSAKKQKSKKTEDDADVPVQPPPTIIFCARAQSAAYLTLLLKSLSIRSTALHSRLTQRERLNSLSLFRSSVVPVLICTDVGARGLDIDDVALVLNWDMPKEPEEYTHRVGRTARQGRVGMAVSFVTERDEERMLRIEERIRMKLAEMKFPEDKVLEKLNAVSTAKRLANMELHDSNFGKREEIHKAKKLKHQNRSAIVEQGDIL